MCLLSLFLSALCCSSLMHIVSAFTSFLYSHRNTKLLHLTHCKLNTVLREHALSLLWYQSALAVHVEEMCSIKQHLFLHAAKCMWSGIQGGLRMNCRGLQPFLSDELLLCNKNIRELLIFQRHLCYYPNLGGVHPGESVAKRLFQHNVKYDLSFGKGNGGTSRSRATGWRSLLYRLRNACGLASN